MTEVQVSGLTKKYGVLTALHELDLTIASGQFVTLLGPSGCGKTTTLRCLAGLERPTSGRIVMGDRVVVDTARRVFVPADKRQVGMVFQSYALWPHLNVTDNIAYPLKVARMPGRERAQRVQEMLDAVGLSGLGKRPVTALSGGQQQRVALARALAARPGIIFYDEPLSNLDSKLRYQMGQQVRSLHNRFETTSVYVTHDQEEAITLSDRIIVMNEGVIVQDGTPSSLYDRPNSAYVADFMGFQNILPGKVTDVRGKIAEMRVDGTSLLFSGIRTGDVSVGDRADIAFRAAHARLCPAVSTGTGKFSGTVVRRTYLGGAVNLLVRADGLPMRVRIETAELSADEIPAAGEDHTFAVNPDRAVVIPHEGATPAEDDYLTTMTDAATATR
ncbi:ABC transporter ATP-binding protein [Kibdelosporangium phytohabitans]|uniref:ABC transporter ATP-binding protein n=1 Tax=Kibdelosporangium phytohabitans TaxID=860235 RepID=A0A0N9I7S6_9PSEU|nr:ABC transporter ATP-binding protein [Kibdelosporangium phytohabitans]ALG12209.1 ABC transporter ATP-binding protein [Kibdelosporangium phytohabitans]MBE1463744.1 iron(III) transport system ATP-binding protein [Kibdelosporangium phytohabitans]